MNTIVFNQKILGLVSIATAAVLAGGLPAVAQTADSTSIEAEAMTASPVPVENSVEVSNSTSTQEKFHSVATPETDSPTFTPIPGTVTTSSTGLTTAQDQQSTSQPSAATQEVAQSDILPGRATRGGSSYIGIAANIGLAGGDSSLGDANFMVISKVGLSRSLSVRPSLVVGDNTTILIPVTYDFSFQQLGDPFSDTVAIAPYVGAGAAINTGDNSQVSFLLSGGVDFPLNSQFTATAAVNAAFFDETDIGLTLGVGYNFGL
ncbi:hypothetical protein [Fischerella sp. JS2]|uniref:hypothetical protein n=1 Tax=Fischerella sp. JS2 TaxID=2597771 RepID=UPI0028EA3F4E|nr:hypothetical protein [Fischerella sp. JS2]